jgi:hypothetical protein
MFKGIQLVDQRITPALQPFAALAQHCPRLTVSDHAKAVSGVASKGTELTNPEYRGYWEEV